MVNLGDQISESQGDVCLASLGRPSITIQPKTLITFGWLELVLSITKLKQEETIVGLLTGAYIYVISGFGSQKRLSSIMGYTKILDKFRRIDE
jgi:hypothetical protein